MVSRAPDLKTESKMTICAAVKTTHWVQSYHQQRQPGCTATLRQGQSLEWTSPFDGLQSPTAP